MEKWKLSVYNEYIEKLDQEPLNLQNVKQRKFICKVKLNTGATSTVNYYVDIKII